MLKIILICWAVLGLLIYLIARPAKTKEGVPEKEEGGGGIEVDTIDLLRECFAALSPNSLGRGSVDLLNLETLIRKMEEGEELPDGLALFLLERIPGAGPWAEKLKRGEGA